VVHNPVDFYIVAGAVFVVWSYMTYVIFVIRS
jgi:hypothetical protein